MMASLCLGLAVLLTVSADSDTGTCEEDAVCLLQSQAFLERGALTNFGERMDVDDAQIQRFKDSKQKLAHHYYGQGRYVPDAPVSVDFEIEISAEETGIHLIQTPESIFDARHMESRDPDAELADDNPATWFEVGFDSGGHADLLGYGKLELTSVPMQPESVRAFAAEAEGWFTELYGAGGGWQPVPKMAPHFQTVYRDKHPGRGRDKWAALEYHPLALYSYSGRSLHGRAGASSLHWTIGLPLGSVPALLQLSGGPLANMTVPGRSPEYTAAVLLAVSKLRSAKFIHCTHPKYCENYGGCGKWRPYNLRTHFGDVLAQLRVQEGDAGMRSFEHDVLHLLERGHPPDPGPVYRQGLVDYQLLPEWMELAGVVHPRDRRVAGKATVAFWDKVELPTNYTGMHALLAQLLRLPPEQRAELKHTMAANRKEALHHDGKCGVYGANDLAQQRYTPKDWLAAAQAGQDLMSDLDSPVARTSWSHLVYKSMGAWRTQSDTRQGDRFGKPGMVFLECRRLKDCLPRVAPVVETDFFQAIREIGDVAASLAN